ncbi:CueP family metal-binding protein [Microbacterium aurum]
MKRPTILAAAAAVLALVLVGCSAPDTNPDPAGADLLAEHGLTDMSAVDIIDSLDRMPVSDRPADLIASVQPEALVLTDNVREVTMDMPDDVTYLSIAPYVEQTHECYYHSLTTCRGELSGQDIEVRIVDDTTSEVIVAESPACQGWVSPPVHSKSARGAS